MNKTEFFQALTLWFIVVIHRHIEPSRDIVGWAEWAAFSLVLDCSISFQSTFSSYSLVDSSQIRTLRKPVYEPLYRPIQESQIPAYVNLFMVSPVEGPFSRAGMIEHVYF